MQKVGNFLSNSVLQLQDKTLQTEVNVGSCITKATELSPSLHSSLMVVPPPRCILFLSFFVHSSCIRLHPPPLAPSSVELRVEVWDLAITVNSGSFFPEPRGLIITIVPLVRPQSWLMSDPVSFSYVMHVAHVYGFSASSLKTAEAGEMQIAAVAFVLSWCSWSNLLRVSLIRCIWQEYLILRAIKLK